MNDPKQATNGDNVGLAEEARGIATKAHDGQVRKTDGQPYIVHPLAVADIVKQHGFSETVIAAALVHDVLEDTDVSETELRQALGDAVVDIVTAVSEDKDLPWEERKQQYIAAVVAAGEGAQAVSVADKIHNAQYLITGHEQQGPVIWQKFSQGKAAKLWFENRLLTELRTVWDHPLLDEYESLIRQLEALPD